jgi:hypothetical protein
MSCFALVEGKVSANHKAMLAASIAALGTTASGAAAGINSPQPTLTADVAMVQFPWSSIPASVPNSASGGVSADGYLAKFTGMIGPITRNTFLLHAPQGGEFVFEGGIVGDVSPGVRICVSYEIEVQFTGGKVNWGTGTDVFAPRTGVFHTSESGQLVQSGVLTDMVEYEFQKDGSATGTFRFDFAFNWVSARESDTLTIDVRTVQVEVCSVPAPGAVVLAGLGLGLAASRRRR